MFKGWQLPAKRASLGVAMVGDRQFCLIPSTLAIPCRAKQVGLVRKEWCFDRCWSQLRQGLEKPKYILQWLSKVSTQF